MKIGIDIHGVMDRHPDFFKSLISFLEQTGHTVCVVTGMAGDQAVKDLENAGYDDLCVNLYSMVDYLLNKGVKFDMSDPENPWCDDQIWWDAKARICQEYGIDYLIDDSYKYESAFDLIDAKFIHLSKLIPEDDGFCGERK